MSSCIQWYPNNPSKIKWPTNFNNLLKNHLEHWALIKKITWFQLIWETYLSKMNHIKINTELENFRSRRIVKENEKDKLRGRWWRSDLLSMARAARRYHQQQHLHQTRCSGCPNRSSWSQTGCSGACYLVSLHTHTTIRSWTSGSATIATGSAHPGAGQSQTSLLIG